MEKVKHIGKNLRSIRLLRGMKQETFAKKFGIAQQNVSKMENKKELTEKQIEQAAKILQTTSEAIKNFDENNMIQNNLFNDQVNNFNPVEKVVELYERMLKEVKSENEKLLRELESYRKAEINLSTQKKSSKIDKSSKETKLKSVSGKQAAQ